MRLLKLPLSIATTLVVSAVAGLALHAGMALAQSDASSTDTIATITDTSSSSPDTAIPITAATGSEVAPAPSAPAASPLKLVRVVGKKYIDYFIDGGKTVAFPGDPAISANLDKPDAPIPTHGNLVWDHTISVDEYDTTTGDLGINEYAVLPDGTYRVHLAASLYKDATSTAQLPDRVVVTSVDPITPPSADQTAAR